MTKQNEIDIITEYYIKEIYPRSLVMNEMVKLLIDSQKKASENIVPYLNPSSSDTSSQIKKELLKDYVLEKENEK